MAHKHIILLSLLFILSAKGFASPFPEDFQRGICIEGTRKLESCHIEEFKSLGVTSISLNPFGWMQAPDRPELRLNTRSGGDPHKHRFWGETDEGLRQYARMAHQAGMEVMIRPHIWLRRNSDRAGRTGLWLGDIEMTSEEDWGAFFANYERFILHYARLAEETGAEWLSIGAEMTRTTMTQPERWRALISEIRAVYRGKLLYSANWWEEVEGIAFWDRLDAIGVQAYYPIAEQGDATVEELARGWQPHLEKLKDLSHRFDRPVIFTEVGYKSTAESPVRPWEWREDSAPRPDVQLRCYQATIRALQAYPEIQGVYWWKYHVLPCGREPQSAGGRFARGTSFTWQGKPAEAVIREAFSPKETPEI